MERGNQDIEDRWNLDGDDALTVEKYWEYKKRAQDGEIKEKIQPCLACMESWLRIRGNLPFQERADILKMAEDTDWYYRQAEIRLSDAESIWTLAGVWLELEENEKAFLWYRLIKEKIQEELGASHKLYADALVHTSDYYDKICDFERCESYCDAALNIYKKEGVSLDESYKLALARLAVLYRRKGRFQDALAIYDLVRPVFLVPVHEGIQEDRLLQPVAQGHMGVAGDPVKRLHTLPPSLCPAAPCVWGRIVLFCMAAFLLVQMGARALT